MSPQKDPVINICQAADRQLYQLVEWAKHIPHFTELPIEDQMVLLKAGEVTLSLIIISYFEAVHDNFSFLANFIPFILYLHSCFNYLEIFF